MQHIPLRVIKARVAKGLHPHIPFATVVTDFTTCHNTWFHKGACVRACLASGQGPCQAPGPWLVAGAAVAAAWGCLAGLHLTSCLGRGVAALRCAVSD
jgi:hypothetical protein